MSSNNPAINAVAIAVGIDFKTHGDFFHAWGERHNMGDIEFYQELAELAQLSCTLMNHVYQCPDFINDGFPGVYQYEVDEEFGKELASMIDDGELDEEGFQANIVREVLGRLATDFFDKAGRPIPQADQIILNLTGFSRSKRLELDGGKK